MQNKPWVICLKNATKYEKLCKRQFDKNGHKNTKLGKKQFEAKRATKLENLNKGQFVT